MGAFALYFALAGWAKLSYVDPLPDDAVQLIGPFVREDGFAWRVGEQPWPIDGARDLYENGVPLERREDYQGTIAVPGRFLNDGGNLVFSVRGDPNASGRIYYFRSPRKSSASQRTQLKR